MAEKSGVEQSALLTTVKSVSGDIVLQCDTAGRTISQVVGGVLTQSLSSGDAFLKSHSAYSLSGVHRKTFVVSTTDATTTALVTIACPSGYALSIRAHILGMQDDMTDATCGTVVGCVTNNAGTTAVKGTASVIVVESNASTNITFTADDTADTALVNVVGIAAENYAWTAVAEWMFVKTATA